MKHFAGTFLCMITLICYSPSSYAGGASNSGFTVGIGGAIVFENFDTGSDDFTFDDSSGFNLKAGYRISDYLAMELDYLLLDDFKGQVYGIEAAKIDGNVFTVNAKLYPFTGQIQPYGLLGIGFADLNFKDTLGLDLSESETDTVIRAGAGMDLVFNSNLTFFTELSYYFTQGDLEDLDFMPVTAGIKITF